MVLGVFLRVWDLGQAAFWHDEAWLALDVLESSSATAVFGVNTHHGNSSPFLFTLLVRWTVQIFGATETVFRAWPCVFSCLTMLVLVLALRRLEAPPWVVLMVLTLFVCNRQAIDFAKELKQYSAEAFAAILLLWLYARCRGQALDRVAIFSSLAATLLYLLSHTALLIAGPVALALLLDRWSERRDRTALLLILAVHAAVVVGLALFVWRHQRVDSLVDFWREYFPASLSLGDLGAHFWRQFSELFTWHFRKGIAPLMALLFVLGVLRLAREDRGLLWVAVLGPLALGFLASCLKLFPFGAVRLCLYLQMVLFLPMAYALGGLYEGARWLSKRYETRPWAIWLTRAAALLLLIFVFWFAGRAVKKQIQKPKLRPRSRAFLGTLLDQYHSTDKVFIHGRESLPAFSFYTRSRDLQAELISGGEPAAWPKLKPGQRCWLYVTHFGCSETRQREVEAFSASLKRDGARFWQGHGARLFCWSQKPQPATAQGTGRGR